MASPTKTSVCTLALRVSRAALREDLADLGAAAAAIDRRHQVRQPLGLRDPAGDPAFVHAAIKAS